MAGTEPTRGRRGTADFRLLDRDDELTIESVEPLANLPLDVAVLIDVSSSMGRQVRTATASTQSFFEGILTEDDRASLLAFNHDLHLLVPFTNDSDRLRHGAAGLGAWGATRLHDAIVWALFQFSGQPGGPGSRRALIVLSDGADVGQRLPVRAGAVCLTPLVLAPPISMVDFGLQSTLY